MSRYQWNYGRSRNKYRNRKVEADGVVFDSVKEARRWRELTLLQSAGEISDLERQVKFELIPAQHEPDRTGKRGGTIKGKLLERKVEYIADFVYTDVKTGQRIVEDTKGVKTKDYIIKRKLMLYVHNIRVKEV